MLSSIPDPPQRTLALYIPPTTLLLTIETVCAVRGTDAQRIESEVDRGKWRWVWDVSAGARDVRRLRFLAREIAARRTCEFSAQEAVWLVAGQRAKYRTGDLCRLLCVSPATLNRLFDSGDLRFEDVGRRRWIAREALADFLNRRLEGRRNGGQQAPAGPEEGRSMTADGENATSAEHFQPNQGDNKP